MRSFFLVFTILISLSSNAQLKDSVLNDVVVRGFETNQKLLQTAGGIAILQTTALQRFDGQSLVPVLNMVPGVKMDERSPGSYRLAIRGSSLRSPFGVRNVKMYWNEVPLTDANGNTYLNAIDLQSIKQIEILKGPAGSAYGSGIGGAVLLEGTTAEAGRPLGVMIDWQRGSFGQQRVSTQWGYATERANQQLFVSNQTADGYRDHTASNRRVLNWKAIYELSVNRTMSVVLMAADVNYETPGGLTDAQFKANPRASRPKAGQFAGAEEQQAGIKQKNILVGVAQEYRFTDKLSSHLAVSGSYADVRNPFITNYEKRIEQGAAIRGKINYELPTLKLTAGLEQIGTFSNIHNYGNRGGKVDTLQFEDEIKANQRFVFAQALWTLPLDFVLTLGGSLNFSGYRYNTISKPSNDEIFATFDPQLSPRVSLLKNFGKAIAGFVTISRGFTPPSLSEYVTSSQRNINPVLLQPETANQFEIGTRGSILNNLTFDVVAYQLQMQNTVVRRVDDAGRQYFVNAGNTTQRGLEAALGATLIKDKSKIISDLNIFANMTFNDYVFSNYSQLKTDLSGKSLPGVPNKVMVFGLNMTLKEKFYLYSTLNATGKIPLNDGNTVYTEQYANLAAKAGYHLDFKRIGVEFYIGIDNALDQTYSLGNDFNAAGNRFFNVAPARNFFGGVKIRL